jgi:two-component system chemotaxis response regulator CheY
MLRRIVRLQTGRIGKQSSVYSIPRRGVGFRRTLKPLKNIRDNADLFIVKTLIVDDDFTSRLVLNTFLSRHGECHIAVNGAEAVEAFRSALNAGQPYDLICMDLMMPIMNGEDAVAQIRRLEECRGVFSDKGAKIIMTSAVDDITDVMNCFGELCDVYLVKPINLAELRDHIRAYGLMREEAELVNRPLPAPLPP